jgi:hypothetical protein
MVDGRLDTVASHQDQSLVFWQSEKTKTSDALIAFDKVGMKDVVPVATPQDALKRATNLLIKQLGLRDHHPVKVLALSGTNKSKVGLEVRQFEKGDKHNNLPFMFSLGVVETVNANGDVVQEVVIRDINFNMTNMFKWFTYKFKQFYASSTITNEEKLNQITEDFRKAANTLYQDELNYITAYQLTECVQQFITNRKGFKLVGDDCRNWYLPIEAREDYRVLSDSLTAHLYDLVFDPVVNDKLMETVATSLECQTATLIEDINMQVKSFNEDKVKTRRSGQKSRLTALAEAVQRLEYNKKLVKDKIYKSLCSQLRAAEAEVAEEAWSK